MVGQTEQFLEPGRAVDGRLNALESLFTAYPLKRPEGPQYQSPGRQAWEINPPHF
jgi:hypothetical protein